VTISTDQLREDYWVRLPRRGMPGFHYRRPDGSEVRRQADLQRIAALAVPPAWTDVCVSPDPEAELQAFGRDAAGRLQYRYHPDFVQRRANRKWRRMATRGDLQKQGLPREKVMALMTRLLHVAFFRVGSMRYLKQHRTYGLCTLQKKHVAIDGSHVTFEFRGKLGVQQVRETTDRTVARHLAALRALPGRWLFQYEGEDGQLRRVRASELNAYLNERIGPYTAKDFRTWGGTLCAAEYLAEAAASDPPPAPKKTIVAMVKTVAQTLGNTPAVARNSYICPVIIDRFLDGEVIRETGRSAAPRARDRGLNRSEAALRRLLQAP